MSNIVEAKALTKQYTPDQPPAVNNISYEIKAGEIFSLLGPNGAGKTTTISMLSGLIQPTSGQAIVGGFSVSENPLEAKKKIGVIPQEIALYPTLSARQNLIFWGRMYDMSGASLKKRVDEVLEQIGLTDRADDKIDTYSGGMKRRVNIGAGLLHKPDIVFMDEPTVGIDPQSRRAILDMTKDLNAAGMAVLYTTHYMEEAQELSDRIGIQDHGELIALGTLDQLTKMVGEADGIKLHLEEIPEGVMEQLNAVEGVESTTATETNVTLLVDDANSRLPAIISTINNAQTRLITIEIQEPNLEAVFLHLTGRALRD
ncbi:MAG: ABC transporter ATP-binding protein [Chloroflexota bacterium]